LQNIMPPLRCQFCNKKCRTDRGLTQHIRKTEACYEQYLDEERNGRTGLKLANNYLRFVPVNVPHNKRRAASNEWVDTNQLASKESSRSEATRNENEDDYFAKINATMQYNSDGDEYMEETDCPESFAVYGDNSETDDEDSVVVEIDKSIKEDFNQYVKKEELQGRFPSYEVTAIELLHRLRKRSVALNMYDNIMEWHMAAIERRFGEQSSTRPPPKKEALINKLSQRYNVTDKMNQIRTTILPFSRAKARIITNDAKWCLQSLLTDPRICNEDYLFWNDNPFSPPSDDNEGVIGDIITGKAYKESYRKYINQPDRQVLLPVIFYIDGAATAQFSDLPITALKFTLGIFNRKARARPHMWRTLGYVPNYSQEASRGKRSYAETGHVESAQISSQLAHEEGRIVSDKNVVKAQDFHAILEVILKDFAKIMESGFEWDLMYANKRYQGVEFVPYIHMIKCDTEEADLLAGKYLSRTNNVAQLCRYCCCPTEKSDDPRAQYPPKTVEMIRTLVQNGDDEALKQLAQQRIINAWHPLRFGAHNDQGIHGSCPIEMLHALLLGIFKYIRDCFFDEIGSNSRLAVEINGLAVLYGELLSRKSDRDMPKTMFSSGIQQGKLMAKEYSGVMLIIATILQSTKGAELLKKKKDSSFSTPNGLKDWSMLVETLLMWESWLKSDEMKRNHVERAQLKHRYIMYLIRKVAPRSEGMEWKITKFHTIVHYCDDIINFGTPMNYDVSSDESGHKESKIAAKNTQKRKHVFDEQVGTRLKEMHILQLAHQELKFGRYLWEYHLPEEPDDPVPHEEQHRKSSTSLEGPTYLVDPGAADEGRRFTISSRTKHNNGDVKIQKDFVQFCESLGGKVQQHLKTLTIYSTLKQNSIIYRGTHNHGGKAWRDWVMVNWGDEGVQPNKIWGFVDLRKIPENSAISHGGLAPIAPAIYAIVETSELEKEEVQKNSEIFECTLLRIGNFRHQMVSTLEFSLVDVDAFDGPAVVVPDVGGPPNKYLLLRSREQWRNDFEAWLDDEHEEY